MSDRLLSPSYRPSYSDSGFEAIAEWRLPDRVAPSDKEALVRDRRALLAALGNACTVAVAKEALQKLANLCRHQTSMTQEQARQMITALAERMLEYPAEIVTMGCRDYGDRNPWFPAWADLRAVLEPKLDEWRLNLKRLDQLIAKADEAKAAAEVSRKGPLTPELQAKLAAIIGRAAKPMPGHAEPTGEPVRQPRYIKDGPPEWESAMTDQTNARDVA